MLYTAPSGAVQMLFLWIGVILCWIFPQNRTLVAIIMCLPPLAANIVLMQLSVEAGWGTIVSAWLVSKLIVGMRIILLKLHAGILYNGRHVTAHVADQFEFQG